MYLRAMKILQDELKDPKNREEFKQKLTPLFDEEVDKYRKEKSKGYLNQTDIEEVSNRAVDRYVDSIVRGKF
jgi:hypothetical protein